MKVEVKVMRDSNVLGFKVGKEEGCFFQRKDLRNGSIEKSYGKIKKIMSDFRKSNLLSKFDEAISCNKFKMKGRTFTLTFVDDKRLDAEGMVGKIAAIIGFTIQKPSRWLPPAPAKKEDGFSQDELAYLVSSLTIIKSRMETPETEAKS